ncbi:hypothetical protein EMCRGX_G015775 [Ephydatia muelleri]|eukprot:Em0005g150a
MAASGASDTYQSDEARNEEARLDLSNRYQPLSLVLYGRVASLDLSDNGLNELPAELCELRALRELVAKKNSIKSLPDNFRQLSSLEELNLSGNALERFPSVLCDLQRLKSLSLGKNSIEWLPPQIQRLERLQHLYLGGNQLATIPPELCKLLCLESLNLSDNRIVSLPKELTLMTKLVSLQLHKNQLQTLPQDLVRLTNLRELSLRDNPLVLRFIKEWPNTPPSLLELSARAVRTHGVPYTSEIIPDHLVSFLDSAQCCDNAQCKGVYFSSRVQNVKFVDFCGKYRVPLMQYLCSSSCGEGERGHVTSSSSSSDEESDEKRLKRVLLG